MKNSTQDARLVALLQRMDVPNLFVSLGSHMFEGSVTDNHVLDLIKTISTCYSKIRLHHLTKETNAKHCKKKVRKTLSKLIHFKNQ